MLHRTNTNILLFLDGKTTILVIADHVINGSTRRVKKTP